MRRILQVEMLNYGEVLPALAPVAATRTGLKRMPVMNDDEQID
jgi:hypothetical protein